MSKWPMVRFGDLFELHRTAISLDPTSNYIQIGVKSFGKGIFRYAAVDGSMLGKLRYFRFPPKALLVSNIQAWEGALSVTSLADSADCVASNRFFSFLPVDKGAISVDFALRFLLSESGMRQVRAASPGTTARNKTVSFARFNEISIPVPPLEEQRQIAAWLFGIESKSARMLASAGPVAELAGSLRESIFNLHSRNCQAIPLGELLTQRPPDVTLNPSSQIVQAGAYSFGKGLFRRPAITGSETSYRTMTTIHPGDFVYSKLMAWEGAVAMATNSAAGSLATPEFPVFALNSEILNGEYLGVFIRTRRFADDLQKLSTGTNARRRRVHPSEMMLVQIPLPSIEEQGKVAAVATRLSTFEAQQRVNRPRISAILPAALNQVFGSLN